LRTTYARCKSIKNNSKTIKILDEALQSNLHKLREKIMKWILYSSLKQHQ